MNTRKVAKATAILIVWLFGASLAQSQPVSKLKVGQNHRWITYADGRVFIWIGDTMWNFARLNNHDLEVYLDVRKSQGFTVVQVKSSNKDFAKLDFIVQAAATRGMYVAVNIGWKNDVNDSTMEENMALGKLYGEHYKDTDNVIWLTAGESAGWADSVKVKSLIAGIRAGDSGDKLLTIHPKYRRGTAESGYGSVVDFNSWQTSQWGSPTNLPDGKGNMTVWQAIKQDYDIEPTKPTLDVEAWYERNKDFCGAGPFNVRLRAYFSILAGGCGFTYGAGGVWEPLDESTGCSENWRNALHYPGAASIEYLGRFMRDLGQDLLKLRPDQSLVVGGQSQSYDHHIQAALAEDQSYAVVYSAGDSVFSINLKSLTGKYIVARWYNPETGEYTDVDGSPFQQSASQAFDPPAGTGNRDMVLILYDNRKALF